MPWSGISFRFVRFIHSLHQAQIEHNLLFFGVFCCPRNATIFAPPTLLLQFHAHLFLHIIINLKSI